MLTRAVKTRASRGSGAMPPTGNFANLGSLKCHFLHFEIISEVRNRESVQNDQIVKQIYGKTKENKMASNLKTRFRAFLQLFCI